MNSRVLYAVYVHQGEGSAFGVTIPDFPGCFAAADSWNELPSRIQETIDAICVNREFEIPEPSSVGNLSGERFKGGMWVLTPVDASSF